MQVSAKTVITVNKDDKGISVSKKVDSILNKKNVEKKKETKSA